MASMSGKKKKERNGSSTNTIYIEMTFSFK